MPLHSLAVTLHVLAAVVWVGGMFMLYVCLRPALGAFEPQQRLRIMRATLAKFLPWVWAAVLTILVTGYWMLFATFGGFSGAGPHIHWMQLFGWTMVGLFLWVFHGPWLSFRRAVDAQDWPGAGGHLDRIRRIVAMNLPLGLLVIALGAGGRYWG